MAVNLIMTKIIDHKSCVNNAIAELYDIMQFYMIKVKARNNLVTVNWF